MEILLASLLLFWGNVADSHPDLTIEQMVQASLDSRNSIVQESTVGDIGEDGIPAITKENFEGNQEEWVKIDPQLEEAPIVKGVYATGYTANGSTKWAPILKLLDETELNSLVIDVKEDYGYITYKTDNPDLEEMGTISVMISDMDKLFATLDRHDIYPIARIVVFKDTLLANKRPDLSFIKSDGKVWHNAKSKPEAFVNPYKKEVWEYNVDVAKEAVKLGFKEIQFDYVRFPEGFENKADSLIYAKDDRTRAEVITEFVKYAREQLNPLGVRVSVDIFGFAASSSKSADGIGQDFNEISKYVDVISPMVYPSHYTTGWFGSKVPDAEPYITINGAMKDTHKKLEAISNVKPVIRPWIQDFTAKWIPGYIPYGKAEVEAQIKAMKDNGIHEFLLWNSSNIYTPGVDYDLE